MKLEGVREGLTMFRIRERVKNLRKGCSVLLLLSYEKGWSSVSGEREGEGDDARAV
jgi:hypothetical protein